MTGLDAESGPLRRSAPACHSKARAAMDLGVVLMPTLVLHPRN